MFFLMSSGSGERDVYSFRLPGKEKTSHLTTKTMKEEEEEGQGWTALSVCECKLLGWATQHGHDSASLSLLNVVVTTKSFVELYC